MSCRHEHHEHGVPAHEVADQLILAADRIEASGERFTAPRRRVLELLLSDGGPVKAYDLMARYSTEGGPAKPPTVYRALDFLEGQGLVHRLQSVGAFVACRMGEAVHAAGFLLCDCCGAAQEIAADPQAVVKAGARLGFEVRSVTLEAHGLCTECKAA